MKILLFTNTHNELSQRAYIELVEQGHSVNVLPVTSEASMVAAAAHWQPQLIIASFLKQSIPAYLLQKYSVLIIRSGALTDRGPYSLKGESSDNLENCRITFLQAAREKDSQEISIVPALQMRPKSKHNLYKHHIAQATLQRILETVAKFERNLAAPKNTLPLITPQRRGRLHSIGL